MSWSNQSPSSRRSKAGWAAARRATLTRDGGQCQIHGPRCAGEATQVDHILPVSEGGTDHPDNLRAVCTDCHDQKTRSEAARGQQRRAQRGRHPKEQHPGIN